MSQIVGLSSTIMQMRQSQLQDQLNVRLLKMSIDAEKDVAAMLMDSVKRIQEITASTEGRIDVYV